MDHSSTQTRHLRIRSRELRKEESLYRRWRMVLNMKESGMCRLTNVMEREIRFGLMAHSMKAIGGMIRLMARADLFMRMVTSMKENGETTRLMDSESTCTQTELSMKDTGKKISNTERAKKLGLTVHSMRAITLRERKMALEDSDGLMAQPMKENSKTTTFTEVVSTCGQILANMKESG